jgi:hypothetical protein
MASLTSASLIIGAISAIFKEVQNMLLGDPSNSGISKTLGKKIIDGKFGNSRSYQL